MNRGGPLNNTGVPSCTTLAKADDTILKLPSTPSYLQQLRVFAQPCSNQSVDSRQSALRKSLEQTSYLHSLPQRSSLHKYQERQKSSERIIIGPHHLQSTQSMPDFPIVKDAGSLQILESDNGVSEGRNLKKDTLEGWTNSSVKLSIDMMD